MRVMRLLQGIGVTLALAWPLAGPAQQIPQETDWREALQRRLALAEAQYPGELGVYVKDLESGEALSYRGDEMWYLASMIKVPVAIAILRAIERGELTFDSTMALERADYVDGAGNTNWQPVGSKLRIDRLMEQMLTVSDNTASDMLIRQAGMVNVNRVARELVPVGLGPITRLVDVRRNAYSHLHPRAFELTGMDFIELRKAPSDSRRLELFRQRLGLAKHELRVPDLDVAFARYYDTDINAGQLSAYGELLESIVEQKALEPESTHYLLSVMQRVTTGERRLKAGLPNDVRLAHKTGTQRRRTCDAGIASRGQGESERHVVIVACTRGSLSLAPSETALAAVGRAIDDSGVL